MRTIVVIFAVIGVVNVICMVAFAWLIWANERAGRRHGEQAARQLGGWR